MLALLGKRASLITVLSLTRRPNITLDKGDITLDMGNITLDMGPKLFCFLGEVCRPLCNPNHGTSLLHALSKMRSSVCSRSDIVIRVHSTHSAGSNCQYALGGMQPLEHSDWNTAIGTQPLEHGHWNTAIGTRPLEHSDQYADSSIYMRQDAAVNAPPFVCTYLYAVIYDQLSIYSHQYSAPCTPHLFVKFQYKHG
eukprot:1159796-Pelagomonas_calceolata.AAC.7